MVCAAICTGTMYLTLRNGWFRLSGNDKSKCSLALHRCKHLMQIRQYTNGELAILCTFMYKFLTVGAVSEHLEVFDKGTKKPRLAFGVIQVVSGLVKFVPVDQMQKRRVVVVTNLKPAKMRDVMSYGMVCCNQSFLHIVFAS